MSFDGRKQFWETPEEIRKIQQRREIRQRLQNEFNRVYYNPYRIAHHIEVLDPAISRYSAMRASIYENWKPNWRSFWKYMFISWIPIITLGIHMRNCMLEVDAGCRTGEIPYEKRDFRRI